MRSSRKLFRAYFAVFTIACFLIQTGAASSQTLKGIVTPETSETIAPSAPPQYQIYDIGVVQSGDTASQGFGVATGGTAVGRSVRSNGAQAFSWTRTGGIVGLPNLQGRAFCVSNGANNSGGVAGTCAATLFGTNRLPVIWQNGSVSQLPLPGSETLGDANDVNASGVAVGSAGSGSLQRGVIYSGSNATVITQTTPGGSFFLTAFGINDSGRVVGQGIDPGNAARNVGIVYDIGGSSAFEVPALPNANGALAFGVGNAGHVVGSSMQNQGSGLPFIWSQNGGTVAIPLPSGTTQGSARAVNSSGWAVGNASGQFSIPFLYDGAATYRLADLIPAGTGWDLSMNTSSSALGISDDNVIVGTGVYNGQVRAYAMIPAVRTTPFDFDGDGRTDYAVFRPSNGAWYLQRTTAGAFATQFGAANDRPVPADFDGDGRADIAVYRDNVSNNRSFFYILNSSNNAFRGEQFGATGDDPRAVGDWDGDGRADLAVFRTLVSIPGNNPPTNFYYRPSGTPGIDFRTVQWGMSGDRPVAGDYDGDRRTDAAVYRPATATWYILQSSNNQPRYQQWGSPNDKLVPGDYDGDARTDPAIYRDGLWAVLQSSNNQQRYQQWGTPTDRLVPGDYDGDGRIDFAVWRAGVYYILRSGNSQLQAFSFGAGNDVPVASAFVE